MLAADRREALTNILTLSMLLISRYKKYTDIANVTQYRAIPIIYNEEFKFTDCMGLSNAPCRETQPAHVTPKMNTLYTTFPIEKPWLLYSACLEL
jgi:hypothetical protein